MFGPAGGRRSKGQIAFEFIIVYSFILVLFLVLFGLVAVQRSTTLNAQQYASVQLVAQDIASYIDQALVAGSGYNATLSLPVASSLQPYNLFITSGGAVIANETVGTVLITGIAYSSARDLLINGTIVSSYNGITVYSVPAYTGSLSVTNIGGTIYIDMPTSRLAASAQHISVRDVGNTEAFNFKNTSVHGIVVPQSASMNKAWDGGSWTINTWFMDTHAPQTGTGRDLIEESNGCTSGMWIQNTSAAHYSLNTIQWYSSGGACTNAGAVGITSGAIPYNTWVMGTSVFSYNGAGGGYVEICVDAHCTNATWSSTSPSNYSKYGYDFLINDNDCCNGWQIGGELANVQLYSSALTQAQIAQLYREGITGAPVNASSLEGWWPLNGNANDYSGNGNNGVPGYTLNYSNVAQVDVNLKSSNAAGSAGTIVGAASSAGSASVTGKAFTVTKTTDTNGNATVFVTSNSTAGMVNVAINAFNYNASLQSHLVGWWPLDEGYGSAVHDMSGNGNNGTFVGQSWTQFANTSAFQVAQFDGQGAGTYTGDIGSYINVTGSPVLKPTNVTVGAWVKANSDRPWMFVAGVQTTAGWGSYYLSMTGNSSGEMTFGTYNGTPVRANSTPLELGKWYYVTGTYNGTDASIYVDGRLSASVPDSQLIYYLPAEPFRIGNLKGFNDWNGIIANVQVYNTSLSAQQIAQQYAAGITAMPLSNTGLVGWWPLDGNANDYSVYANSGTANSVTFNNMQAAATSQGIVPVANFNGANYVSISTIPDISGSSAGTISALVYIDSLSSDQIILSDDWGAPAVLQMYVHPNGQLEADFGSGSSWIVAAETDAGSITAGKWYSVTATWTSGAGENIYINGIPQPISYIVGSSASTGTLGTPGTGYIGYNQNGNYFSGKMANLQVYNTALTSQQVQQLYAQGLPLYAKVNVSLS